MKKKTERERETFLRYARNKDTSDKLERLGIFITIEYRTQIYQKEALICLGFRCLYGDKAGLGINVPCNEHNLKGLCHQLFVTKIKSQETCLYIHSTQMMAQLCLCVLYYGTKTVNKLFSKDG